MSEVSGVHSVVLESKISAISFKLCKKTNKEAMEMVQDDLCLREFRFKPTSGLLSKKKITQRYGKFQSKYIRWKLQPKHEEYNPFITELQQLK